MHCITYLYNAASTALYCTVMHRHTCSAWWYMTQWGMTTCHIHVYNIAANSIRWNSRRERGHIDIYMYRCTYTSYCIIQHCTVLYFCKTLILQYRILSCRVLCIYYWCTWAVLSHLWCADRTELCCTVMFGLHSTSRDSTELSWIILQLTTILCSTALGTYSDTMLWGIVLHCTVLHWAVLSTLCDDAWHDSTDDVTYDALMQYIALHCDVTH